jgi:hypothetical protein
MVRTKELDSHSQYVLSKLRMPSASGKGGTEHRMSLWRLETSNVFVICVTQSH